MKCLTILSLFLIICVSSASQVIIYNGSGGDTQVSAVTGYWNSVNIGNVFEDTIRINYFHTEYDIFTLTADDTIKYNIDSALSTTTAAIGIVGGGYDLNFGYVRGDSIESVGSIYFDTSSVVLNNILFLQQNGYVSYNIYRQDTVDLVAPILLSGEVGNQGNDTLTLSFNEIVTIDSVGWRPYINDTVKSIVSVLNSGTSNPYFVLNDTVAPQDTVKVSYVGGNTKDSKDNALASLADTSISNNTQTFESVIWSNLTNATVSGDTLYPTLIDGGGNDSRVVSNGNEGLVGKRSQ